MDAKKSAQGAGKLEASDPRIMLGVLDAADRGVPVTQRRLASELGIALGLTNAYIKRCVRKGLLKVSQVPPRRYAYYLTPKGFEEKVQLTREYLDYSLSLFREARRDCAAVMSEARNRGWSDIILVGTSDVAEIAVLCAIEAKISVVAVLDPRGAGSSIVGHPVVSELSEVDRPFDGLIVTDSDQAVLRILTATAVEKRQILVPAVLRLDLTEGRPGRSP